MAVGVPFVHHETSKDRAVAERHAKRDASRAHAAQSEALSRIARGEALQVPPVRLAPAPNNQLAGGATQRMGLEQVDGLEAKLRRNGNEENDGSTEGTAVDVVQSDGKLVSVQKRSDAATPSAFPTVLKVVNGTTSITLDSTGITMTDTAGSGKSLTISFSDLLAGKAVSLRVDDYCDGGTDKNQQHLATAPYA